MRKNLFFVYAKTKEQISCTVKAKGKGLLFNVGSLRKSPPGMDGTTYFQQSPRCVSFTSPIIQPRSILLAIVPGQVPTQN